MQSSEKRRIAFKGCPSMKSISCLGQPLLQSVSGLKWVIHNIYFWENHPVRFKLCGTHSVHVRTVIELHTHYPIWSLQATTPFPGQKKNYLLHTYYLHLSYLLTYLSLLSHTYYQSLAAHKVLHSSSQIRRNTVQTRFPYWTSNLE